MCQTLLSPEDQIMNGTQVFCRWLSSTPVSDLPVHYYGMGGKSLRSKVVCDKRKKKKQATCSY